MLVVCFSGVGLCLFDFNSVDMFDSLFVGGLISSWWLLIWFTV